MQPEYASPYRPLARPDAVVAGGTWRFTVLTDALIRVEYDEDGRFTDAPTQTVQCREFPPCRFTVRRDGEGLTLETDRLLLTYAGGPFTEGSLSVRVLGADPERGVWRFGRKPCAPLGGTARTLDRADGACALGPGLFSLDGWEILDDSASLTITPDGWVAPRRPGLTDLYVFGYGRDYAGGLRDFYRLTGETPMLPRYALGNWWSRYYRYSRDSYIALMDRFREERVPFSVAVIDMDWHLVDIDPRYGTGWTGYTWNRALFPDPPAFLRELRERGMKVTLNLHPADGVRAYEERYPALAAHMGVKPGENVPFDVASPEFMKHYFEDVLHPMEAEGVDFWWIDWQQGTRAGMEGLDPLWMLNRYHFEDSGRDGRRPITFSRYAGPGSHRYPVGFSGDTVVSWDSLNFQPYFTSTADNIGYGWWSHDIGGHMQGIKDDELYGRWVQFGVFSPICRLHSTSSEFNGREPWRYGAEVCQMAESFLRLRHRLIPYLYTMNHRAWAQGQPLCQPMYYLEPENPAAYAVPNAYTFGTQLLCAPITRPAPAGSPASSAQVYLPEGGWSDIFTGVRYSGGRTLAMYRDIRSFPVLAPDGAILPLDDYPERAAQGNPGCLTVRVYPGANGAFTLYEDDNETTAYRRGDCALTDLVYTDGAQPSLRIAAHGQLDLLPAERRFTVELMGVQRAAVTVRADGELLLPECAYDEERAALIVRLPALSPEKALELTFLEGLERAEGMALRCAYAFLDRAQMPYNLKQRIYDTLCKAPDAQTARIRLETTVHDPVLLGALLELIDAHPGAILR